MAEPIFEKCALIGDGLYSKVFLVRHRGSGYTNGSDESTAVTASGTPYAMKVLNKNLEPHKIMHIITEYNILSQLDHPFLSSMCCCFQSNENLYMIMHYYIGGDLYAVIKQHPTGCLTEVEAKFYISCVLLALEYLHTKGIIYRDLKPENILMDGKGHIVLTDFNLSTIVVDKLETKIITRPFSNGVGCRIEPNVSLTECVGTPEYMSPEMIACDPVTGKGYGCSTDWWSLGILLHEMIYGTTPFRGISNQSTYYNIRARELELPKKLTLSGKIDHHTKSLLKMLIVKDPQNRLNCASAIKDHPYFKDVEFQLLKSQVAPIIPVVSDPFDVRYFKCYTSTGSNVKALPRITNETSPEIDISKRIPSENATGAWKNAKDVNRLNPI